MSIKIHHGAPGSYKTSGAVMDDLPPAVFEGRTVVTNVRGLTNEAVIRAVLAPRFPGKPSPHRDFRLINVDTSDHAGLERLRRWFHWVPKGSLLIIDEAQRVWPPAWRDSDLRKLDYPGGTDAAEADGRPEDHWVAFDMHRHHNWDLVLTTPNMKKIRSEIRDVAEGGYFHRNRALFGFGKSYMEAFHTADNLGTSQSDLITTRKKRIKRWVWKLYASTATGEHRDTTAGSPFWKDPKIVGLCAVLVLLVGFVATRPPPKPLAAAAGVDEPAPQTRVIQRDGVPYAEVVPVSSALAPSSPTGAPRPAVSGAAEGGKSADGGDPLAGWELRIVGEIRQASGDGDWRIWVDSRRNGAYARLDRDQLEKLGYTIERNAPCLYSLTWDKGERLVGCEQKRSGQPAKLFPVGGA